MRKMFSRYWKAYGGWESVFKSSYFYCSVLLTLISFGIWSRAAWYEIPISVLPNILGFSLGGYAIWLALGDQKFYEKVTGKSQDSVESPFMKINSAFVHFIVLQIIALIFALVFKAHFFDNLPQFIQSQLVKWIPNFAEIVHYLNLVFSGIGYLLFIYAIFAAFAATMAIFRIAGWLDTHHSNQVRFKKENIAELKQKQLKLEAEYKNLKLKIEKHIVKK